MARKSTAADEAPYGWSVIGEDGRRIDRWLSITAAQELVARIAANSDEDVTLEPSEPTALSQAQAPEPVADAKSSKQ
jgi:hypothetical protein